MIEIAAMAAAQRFWGDRKYDLVEFFSNSSDFIRICWISQRNFQPGLPDFSCCNIPKREKYTK
jgi:hypothetical protein